MKNCCHQGNGKFLKVSFLSWQRGANPLILWRPPTLPTSPCLFKILSTPPLAPRLPCHLQPPPLLLFFLSYFFGWMGYYAKFDWCVILLREEPWCVFYAIRRQFYWGLTHFFRFLVVLWFDITHTNAHNTLKSQ